MKSYDEHHEYRVDTQRWTTWPKALIMTHEWSTNGHDRRIEQRRYVPDDYATKLEMENSRIRANAEYQKKVADEELDEVRAIRHNIDRLRERVHEVAADRDRIKAENAKLRELVGELWELLELTGNDDLYAEICHNGEVVRTIDADELLGKMRKLGIEAENDRTKGA